MKKVISVILLISVFVVSVFSLPSSAAKVSLDNNTYDEDFEKNLENFPEDYRQALRNLHNSHPNWIFVADKLSMSFDDAVTAEYSGRNNLSEKAVPEYWNTNWRSSQPGSYSDGSWKLVETGWYYASKEAIAYYADPRNFLTADGIFMFAQQSYDKNTQTVEGLKTIIKGSFLENGYNGDKNAYINDIMSAAESTKLSPYVIAATIIAEQGVAGASDLISGTYSDGTTNVEDTLGDTDGNHKITLIDLANIQKHLLHLITLTGDNFTRAKTHNLDKSRDLDIIDLANVQKHLLGLISLNYVKSTDTKYVGYYNFFNVGVTGDPKVKLGLERAITEGWNSRSKAITGGAKFYAEKYVSVGQCTYYYKDWNFVNTPYYSHQYATNVKDAYNNGYRFSQGFPQDASMTFLIPVFTSMPSEISPNPDNITK